MLEIVATEDLKAAAHFTFNNMKPYYEIYAVDWDVEDVYQATKNLKNFDILCKEQHIGVVRLSFDEGRCQLRDIQIAATYQNKGFGAHVIAKVVDMARQQGVKFIDLKVFQLSPAFKLYSRIGFAVDREDDRFYYMSLQA
ncbi:N-acetyltransferase [Pseudoalteromonas sp. Angola-7]|uniref:GNAT family N-acetyltransferase n=1 Tax=Pseudoalteromonas sp. Angola-7 TaxID=3025336 RepID=UPI002359BC0F|nr:GNAT family N-acetyltransferase [Pseudoalteromonas sp. Angola-7]MDC9528489.1 GNAT family N-acetyltransferase [Pseudoalteromonas sp. Angola-7]